MTTPAFALSPAFTLTPGFTLTEVLVTLAIISMIMSLSIVQMRSAIVQKQLQNSARTVAGYVQRAQLRSLVSGTETRIDETYLAAQQSASPDAGALPGAASTALESSVAITVETPVRIAPDGACSPGAVRLALRDSRYLLSIAAPFCDTSFTRVE